MKIYNTLTRQKDEFIPLEQGKVKMYVCGPTVYNYIHIGNARSTIAFDTIRRYFEYRGYDVNYVSNFTDVDDKIIRVAKEEGITAQAVAEKFIKAFNDDVSALNVLEATDNPRVMNYIPEIISFIESLIQKGYAYEVEGDVYFSTRKFNEYGKLSHQSVDDLEIGASQRTGAELEIKSDPLDFALWKSAKVDEISWESPWGSGRPGWHIECSVMATTILGDTIDIHGGGQDLEFPHHENEIAQSECKTGKQFANYWMHNGYVTVGDNEEKMSKSLGNFVTVHELIQKVPAEQLRFLMATTQYRRPIQFNETTLRDAGTNLQKIKTAYENLLFRLQDAHEIEDADRLNELDEFEARFVKEMDDDFNSANGITIVYELTRWMNNYAKESQVSVSVVEAALTKLRSWLGIFGIELEEQAELLDDTIEELILERNQARKDRNFARSDEIRDLLKDQGIILEDTSQGTRWKRV